VRAVIRRLSHECNQIKDRGIDMEFTKVEAGDYRSTDGKIRIAHVGCFWYRVSMVDKSYKARICHTLRDALKGDKIVGKPMRSVA
jgi:hypothetical protein